MKRKLMGVLAGIYLVTALVLPVTAAPRTAESPDVQITEETGGSEDVAEDSTEEDTEETATQTAAEQGIKTVQVEAGIELDDGSFDMWTSSVGFSIDGSHIVSAVKDLRLTNESDAYKKAVQEKQEGYASLGIDINNFENVRSRFAYRIYDGSASLITCSSFRYDEKMGLMVFELSRPCGDAAVFTLTDPEYGDVISAQGFVGTAMDGKTYADESSLISQNIEIKEVNGDGTFTFNNPSAEYFTGSPVIDKDGFVCAVVTGSSTAVMASKVMAFLDDNDVVYESREAKPETDKSALKESIDSAQSIDDEKYTTESLSLMFLALSDAEGVYENDEADQTMVDRAASDLNETMGMLEEKKLPLVAVIMIIAIGVTLVSCIAAIVSVSLKKKRKEEDSELAGLSDNAYEHISTKKELRAIKKEEKKNAKAEKERAKLEEQLKKMQAVEHKTEEQSANIRESAPAPVYAPSPMPAPEAAPYTERVSQRPQPHTVAMNRGGFYEEMLTVDDDMGTELLNGNAPGRGACLIRRSSNETFHITKGEFVVGKEPTADAVIRGNRTVSRHHVVITYKNENFWIQDLGSLNGTYINDRKIKPDQVVPLNDGTRIRMSDEEFIFGMEN